MKTVTPNELGEFAESLLQGASQQTEILIVRDGEVVARIENRPIDRAKAGKQDAATSVAEMFKQLREKRAGVNIDMETLRAYRDEGRR
jgi:hypothetical protein